MPNNQDDVLDLASTEAPVEPNLVPVDKQQTKAFDLQEAQETVRGRIAYALVGLLASVVLLAFITLWVSMYINQLSSDQPPTASYPTLIQDQPTPAQQGSVPPQASAPSGEITLRDLLAIVFTPIIGLVGAATGFYYGGVTAKL